MERLRLSTDGLGFRNRTNRDSCAKVSLQQLPSSRPTTALNQAAQGQNSLATRLRPLSSVEALVSPDTDSNWVRLRNRGPVPLNARVPFAETAVSLAPYGEVLLAGTAGKTLTIGWTNVWVGSDQTIELEHEVVAQR